MIELTASDYYELNHNAAEVVKVDSVNGAEIYNEISEEEEVFETIEATEGTLLYDDSPITFPLNLSASNSIKPSFWQGYFGYHTLPTTSITQLVYKCRAEIIMAYGSKEIHLTQPLEGEPIASMSFSGTSYNCPKEKLSWNAIPTDKGSFQKDSSWDAEALELITAKNLEPTSYDPPVSDKSFPYFKKALDTLKITKKTEWGNLHDATHPNCQVTRLSAYDYRIDWLVPIRYIYAAVSRDFDLSGGSNGRFIDGRFNVTCVEALTINLSGHARTEDERAFQVGASTKNPLTLETNELLTVKNTLNGQPWREQIPQQIVDTFKSGKLVAKAHVKASWFWNNGIVVGSRVRIRNSLGLYVGSRGAVAVFEVKNITFDGKAGSLSYTITLLEV